MTEEVRKCVEILRYCEEGDGYCGGCPSGKTNGIPNCYSQSHIAALIESLSSQLDQVTRERDAAIRDMILGRICATCRHHNNSATSKCAGCISWHSNWQWHGVEVEDGNNH